MVWKMYLRSNMAILAIHIYIYNYIYIPDDLLQVSETSSEKMLITAFSSYTGLIVRWLYSVLRSIADSSRHIFAFFFRIPRVYTQMVQG